MSDKILFVKLFPSELIKYLNEEKYKFDIAGVTTYGNDCSMMPLLILHEGKYKKPLIMVRKITLSYLPYKSGPAPKGVKISKIKSTILAKNMVFSRKVKNTFVTEDLREMFLTLDRIFEKEYSAWYGKKKFATKPFRQFLRTYKETESESGDLVREDISEDKQMIAIPVAKLEGGEEGAQVRPCTSLISVRNAACGVLVGNTYKFDEKSEVLSKGKPCTTEDINKWCSDRNDVIVGDLCINGYMQAPQFSRIHVTWAGNIVIKENASSSGSADPEINADEFDPEDFTGAVQQEVSAEDDIFS